MGNPSNATVASVRKALGIFDFFIKRREPVSATEISRALGHSFSSVHHLISTMRDCGYLEQDPETRKYKLARKVLQLGLVAQQMLEVIDKTRPILNQLSAEIDETASLAIPDGLQMMYVAQSFPSGAVLTSTKLGARVPLHCTGVGKAYLAQLSLEEAKRLALSAGLARFTENTITQWDVLENDLKTVRNRGYATASEEQTLGMFCIAAPILDLSGSLCGVLSVSGPTGRLALKQETLAQAVVAAALRVYSDTQVRTNGPGHVLPGELGGQVDCVRTS